MTKGGNDMSYMPKVAKMLGVEVEQIFKIESLYADAPDDLDDRLYV